MNASIYLKIDNMSYEGKEIFYKKPINTELHVATEFSKHYEYFYKEIETDENPKYLGKFVEKRMYRSSCHFDEYDHPILAFENENIFDNKTKFIYCKGIPDLGKNIMHVIDNMAYENFSVYYKK